MSNNDLPIIDSHSHIQFPAYDTDRAEVIRRAVEAGVKMIAVGTQISTSEAGIKLAQKYPEDVWATVGYHPSHVIMGRSDRSVGAIDSWHHDKNEQAEAMPEKFDIRKLRELAKDPKVVAIGECGLDYYRVPQTNADGTQNNAEEIRSKQKEVFLQQAELAKELNKPLMIHCRPAYVKTPAGKAIGTDDAYGDLLNLSQMSKVNSQMSIVHFYVGSLEMTKKLVDADFYFTFGGVVTFARDYDESIKYIPIERILLETDCPYVAPKSQRGKRNEPAFILETAEAIARIKDIKIDEFLDITYKNSREVFKI